VTSAPRLKADDATIKADVDVAARRSPLRIALATREGRGAGPHANVVANSPANAIVVAACEDESLLLPS
jgi:hypothetical protein